MWFYFLFPRSYLLNMRQTLNPNAFQKWGDLKTGMINFLR